MATGPAPPPVLRIRRRLLNPMFVTAAKFLPQHRGHLEHIDHAEQARKRAADNTRMHSFTTFD